MMTRVILGQPPTQGQRESPELYACDLHIRETVETRPMKKKTVITTERREVWVVREDIPDPAQPSNVSDAIEITSASTDSKLPADADAEISERNEEPYEYTNGQATSN